jgi:cobalt-zinc-cadmium efflux system protein
MPHDHTHGADPSNPRLGLSIALTFGFVVGEAVAGYLSESLALLSDAGHNFTDVLALAFSWYAVRAAKRPATSERTFGSHRIGILVALVNALTLAAIGAVIIWEAVQRFLDPRPVKSGPMIWVALAAVILNGLMSVWLHAGAKRDLNLRSAYLHLLGDAVSALGVALAGIFIALTGNPIADPLVSLLLGGFIIWSSWGIGTESLNILLEATPRGLDMAALEQSIRGMHGVLGVHDLHVWTVASGMVACSCHILVSEQSVRDGEQILKDVAGRLRHDFAIGHTTIQVEVEGCEADEMYCTMRPVRESHEGPHHH